MNDQQLRLFEGADVEVCRLTVTGSTDSTQDDIVLPTGWKLGESVSFLARGIVTKVTHARTSNGLERQHVVVIDSMSFEEVPPTRSVTLTTDAVDTYLRGAGNDLTADG